MRRPRLLLAVATALCAAGCATSSPGHGTGAGAVPPPSASTTAPGSSPAPSSSSSKAPSHRPSRPASPPASQSPPTSYAPGPAGASTYTKRGGPNSWCGSAQLAVTGHAPPNGDVAGHTGVQLQFLNKSPQACILYGYPGADGVDGSGRAVAHAVRTTDGYLGGCGCSHPRGVLVKPGQSAYAVVEGDIGGGNCDRFRGLLVTPPNTYRSTPLDLAPHSCHFQVHPVVPDEPGSR